MTTIESLETRLAAVEDTVFDISASLEAYAAKLGPWIEAEDFAPPGVTLNNYSVDATPYINLALQHASTVRPGTGATVQLRSGCYRVDGNAVIPGNGTELNGHAGYGTMLKSSIATNKMVSFSGGNNAAKARNLHITRAVLGTAGSFGLHSPEDAWCDVIVENIWCQYHDIGIQLGAAAWAKANGLRAEYNRTHGILQTNGGATPSAQWYCFDVYVGNNGANGWHCQYHPSVAPGSMAAGQIVGFRSFANAGRGFAAQGLPGKSIQSIRIKEIFSGQNGNDSFYLDTYGNNHQIESFFVEEDGTAPYTGIPPGFIPGGPTAWPTAGSGLGNGILLTANNHFCQLSTGLINGSSQHGLVSSTPSLMLSNVVSNHNHYSGFAIAGGFVQAGQIKASGNLHYGLVSTAGIVLLSGSSFDGNVLGRLLAAGAGKIQGDEAWQIYTPAVTAVAGTLASVSCPVAFFREDVGITHFDVSISIANKGDAATGIFVTMPTPPLGNIFVNGVEAGVTGKMTRGERRADKLLLLNYDGSDPIANGAVLQVTGWYRT